MTGSILLVLIVFAMMAILLTRSVIVVPRDSAYVVERLGRYHTTFIAGLNVLVPFIDRIAFRYSLSPKDEDLTDVCITLDNISVTVTSGYRWRIVDPQRFASSTADGPAFLANLVRIHQRKWIGERRLQTARETTRELEQAIVRSVLQPAKEAGAEISAVNVYSIASSAV